jgi:hypothetical protein
VREQVKSLYEEHGNTAVSWLRALFHDCTVKSCDASLLLETDAARGLVSEQSSSRSFGMRNFKYIDDIKSALERACPGTVSVSNIIPIIIVGWTWSYLYWALGFKGATRAANCYIYETIDDGQGGLERDGSGLLCFLSSSSSCLPLPSSVMAGILRIHVL